MSCTPPSSLHRTGLRRVITNRQPNERVTLPTSAIMAFFGHELLVEYRRQRERGVE